jgi:FkbM family methyltransferase
MHDETRRILRSISSRRGHFAPKYMDVDQLGLASLSYALAGEDLVLRHLFKNRFIAKQAGIYVDIGCSEPVSISNTFLFYCSGWRGLCVDANTQYADMWAAVRGEDTFVNGAVGERAAEVSFFLHKKNYGMSQISHEPNPPSDDFEPTPIRVPMRRLDALFAEHIGDKQIQFMTIDVEGAELGVLRSNDWKRWRPEVILMECAEFDFMAPAASPTVSFLLAQNYVLRLKVGGNVILVREGF